MSKSGYSNQRGAAITGAEEVPLSTAEAQALAETEALGGVAPGEGGEHLGPAHEPTEAALEDLTRPTGSDETDRL